MEGKKCTMTDEDPSEDNENIKEKKILFQRKQPLMELVYSEEGYVKRLKTVKESYIPANNFSNMDTSEIIAKNNTQPPPIVPPSLLPKWRILWGNWLQLFEWHSGFLEKLQTLIERDPDKIPKLFIDSRARLRSIYSKYCENHRKAACIAEKHRDYFEELRIYIGDKEDVVSHLMQPVQRIMRYQLPMGEIVKYTERANLPSLDTWKRALEIMKDIPRDTSLILEAAGIEGFPGVITALGSVRIRGRLSIAFVSQANVFEVITGRHRQLASLKNISEVEVISDGEGADNATTTTPIITEQNRLSTEVVDSLANTVAFHAYTVFLFDQMLLITEESRPSGRKKLPSTNPPPQDTCQPAGTTDSSFAPSVYQFKAAIRVNKMKLASEWWHCARNIPACKNYNLDALFGNCNSPEYGTIDGRFAFWESGTGSVTSMNLSKIISSADSRSMNSGPIYYVVDPITQATREAWLKQLEDIQQMQQNLLIALQDPTKFGSPSDIDQLRDPREIGDGRSHQGQRHKSAQTAPLAQITSQIGHLQPYEEVRPQIHQKKWPSFRIKRPSILNFQHNQSAASSSSLTSSSSAAATATAGSGSGSAAVVVMPPPVSTSTGTPLVPTGNYPGTSCSTGNSNNSSTNEKISCPSSMSESFTSNNKRATTLLRSQSVERRKNYTISSFDQKGQGNEKSDSFFPSFPRLNSTSGITPTSWFSRGKKKDSEPVLLMRQGLSLSSEDMNQKSFHHDVTMVGHPISHKSSITMANSSKKKSVLTTLLNAVGRHNSSRAPAQPSTMRPAKTSLVASTIHSSQGTNQPFSSSSTATTLSASSGLPPVVPHDAIIDHNNSQLLHSSTLNADEFVVSSRQSPKFLPMISSSSSDCITKR